jgi:hypothetical protein
MKFTFLFLCISSFCLGQTKDIVLTTVSRPVQKDIYPQNYWNVWVKDLPRTENAIKIQMQVGEYGKWNILIDFYSMLKCKQISLKN